MAVTPRLSLPQPTGSDLISGGDDAINTGFDTLDSAAMYIDDVIASRPAAGSTVAGTFFYATDTGATYLCTGSAWIEISSGAAVPIGGSVEYAGSGDPADTRWLLEDGRAISRATYAVYAAQQAAAGYPHGAGNGTTTVNIPDSRGRTTVGPDDMGTAAGAAGRMASNKTLGAVSGAETRTLVAGNLPAHVHDVGTLATTSAGTHDHSTGTLAVTGDGAHTHGVGTYAVADKAAFNTSDQSNDHLHGGTTNNNYAGPAGSVVVTGATSFKEGSAAGATLSYYASAIATSYHAHSFVTDGTNQGHVHSVPQHGHTFSGASASATHAHGLSGSVASNGAHTHPLTGSTSSVGGGTAFNQMPPYIVKNKIIRVL
jgi:microcystin-dependent protein